MQLCKVRLKNGAVRSGLLENDRVRVLGSSAAGSPISLSELLYAPDPLQAALDAVDKLTQPIGKEELIFQAPVDQQEIWAAGVTYKRSQEARERESEGAAKFYDLVYAAARPELFFKATADRVVGSGEGVFIRRDSRWSVPEPELALVLSPQMEIVGFTIGNDMSARDIEGENPLYLPQAKIYRGSCSIGPVITLARDLPPLQEVIIEMRIERKNSWVFEGSTALTQMARPFKELVDWLGRENTFSRGAVLLTGTGIVPPDDFSLEPGDLVQIDVTGIGRLVNRVDRSKGGRVG